MRPVVAQQSIGARMPTALERPHLGIQSSRPVLTMTRMAFDGSGGPVEYGDHSYPASDYTITSWSTSADAGEAASRSGARKRRSFGELAQRAG